FELAPPKGALFTPALPAGLVKQDEFFGRVETYRNSMVVNLSLKDVPAGQSVVIRAESQGCADIGICYPPTVQSATITLPAASVVPDATADPAKKTWFN
ncbi:MAG: protein-disulfide reductase DsbD domain-containing protein, partial [Betaproteobacteria bacterium]